MHTVLPIFQIAIALFYLKIQFWSQTRLLGALLVPHIDDKVLFKYFLSEYYVLIKVFLLYIKAPIGSGLIAVKRTAELFLCDEYNCYFHLGLFCCNNELFKSTAQVTWNVGVGRGTYSNEYNAY